MERKTTLEVWRRDWVLSGKEGPGLLAQREFLAPVRQQVPSLKASRADRGATHSLQVPRWQVQMWLVHPVAVHLVQMVMKGIGKISGQIGPDIKQ